MMQEVVSGSSLVRCVVTCIFFAQVTPILSWEEGCLLCRAEFKAAWQQGAASEQRSGSLLQNQPLVCQKRLYRVHKGNHLIRLLTVQLSLEQPATVDTSEPLMSCSMCYIYNL